MGILPVRCNELRGMLVANAQFTDVHIRFQYVAVQAQGVVEHIDAALHAASLLVCGLMCLHSESLHLSPTSLRMIDTWKPLPMSRCKILNQLLLSQHVYI